MTNLFLSVKSLVNPEDDKFYTISCVKDMKNILFGYQLSWTNHGESKFNLVDFDWFVHQQYGDDRTVGFDVIIAEHQNNDQHGLQLFFDLLENYLIKQI